MASQEYVGRRVVLRIDGDNWFEPASADLSGTITGFATRAQGTPVLKVQLDEMKVTKWGVDLRDIVVSGVGMNVVSELFGTPMRPKSFPVVVAAWRLTDAATFERLRTGREHPSGKDFLGRAEIVLAVA